MGVLKDIQRASLSFLNGSIPLLENIQVRRLVSQGKLFMLFYTSYVILFFTVEHGLGFPTKKVVPIYAD